MSAYAYIREDPGRLSDERVMAEDFWPEDARPGRPLVLACCRRRATHRW